MVAVDMVEAMTEAMVEVDMAEVMVMVAMAVDMTGQNTINLKLWKMADKA